MDGIHANIQELERKLRSVRREVRNLTVMAWLRAIANEEKADTMLASLLVGVMPDLFKILVRNGPTFQNRYGNLFGLLCFAWRQPEL
jgi:hypothetical protein